MKKKILSITIASIICAVLSVVAEILIFNFNIIKLDKQNNPSAEISYESETTKNETIIKLNINDKFINKLIIDYDAAKTTNYSLSYAYKGLYGNETTSEEISDKFDNSFSESITNIGETVSNVLIKYSNADSVKINQISIDNEFHFNYFRTIFVFLAFLTIFFLIYFYTLGFSTDKLHIYFAVICTLLGFMLIVAQPAATFYSWDDQIHFETTVNWFGGTIHYSNGEYNLSNSNVTESAGRDSINSADEKQNQINYFNSDIDHNLTKTDLTFMPLDKLSYFPMSIGYNLAKILQLPFTMCFQIGKIFNLLFYVLLMAYAIKISKIGKLLLTFLALLPTNIFLASEYSYDPAVIAGTTIFIVQIINLLLNKTTKFDFKTAIIMIASISYACFAKAIYAPLILLFLLIPKDKFKSVKQSRLAKVGMSILMILLLSLAVFPSLNGGSQSDARGGDTSVSRQFSTIINHPLDYAKLLTNTAGKQFNYRLIGNDTLRNFSYMNPKIIPSSNQMDLVDKDRSNAYYLLLIILIFLFLTDSKGNQLTKKQRLVGIGVVLSIIILIWSALYLSFTPVGSDTINGVQNRYFIPLLFIFLLLIQPKNIHNKIPQKIYNSLPMVITTIITIIMLYCFILAPYSF